MFVPTGYTCALQRDILYQGKLFVSDNWICFHSRVFGRDTKVWYCSKETIWVQFQFMFCGWILWCNMVVFSHLQISIPVASVTFIKKTKTALLVPNALVIETTSYPVRRLLTQVFFPPLDINMKVILNYCFPACVCVLPLSKHHLQTTEVHLRSFGGK